MYNALTIILDSIADVFSRAFYFGTEIQMTVFAEIDQPHFLRMP